MFAWNGCATKHKNNLKHLLHSIYYYIIIIIINIIYHPS